ncbi:MAG: rRNA pseudouridine synthase [candidate division KSB1 bacterium]|nr:rRNA pseudouridine synthase [candidate division KSB1 bacterium]
MMAESSHAFVRNKSGQRVMLARALSKLGLCSRGQAKLAIQAGRVRVNGKVITHCTHWVKLGSDTISVDGRVVRGVENYTYVMLNKPRGYITTRRDHFHRPTVFELLASAPTGAASRPDFFTEKCRWIFPVGRLDYDSEGLLLFTNDGPLGDALINPEKHIHKLYRVLLNRLPSPEKLQQLEAGIRISNYTTLPAKVEIEEAAASDAHDELPLSGHWVRIAIREGKNRQVRRMFAAVGCEVRRLIRIRFGPLELGDLPIGGWRELRADEVQALRRAVEPSCQAKASAPEIDTIDKLLRI